MSNDPENFSHAPAARSQLTKGEKVLRIMALLSDDKTDDKLLDLILNAVEEIVLKREDQS